MYLVGKEEAAADRKVELHPYNSQHRLKEYCEGKGILLQAYSPLGSLGTSYR